MDITLPYYPSAARNHAYRLCRYYAAEIREDGNVWDGEADGKYWIAGTIGHKERSDVAQEQDMHQVHAERQLRYGGNPSRSLLTLDTGEHKEHAEGGKQHVWRAELPRPFQGRRTHLYAGNASMPE